MLRAMLRKQMDNPTEPANNVQSNTLGLTFGALIDGDLTSRDRPLDLAGIYAQQTFLLAITSRMDGRKTNLWIHSAHTAVVRFRAWS
jgi:hypothetical protein